MLHTIQKLIILFPVVFSLSMEAAAQPAMLNARAETADSAYRIIPFDRPESKRPSFVIGIPIQVAAQTPSSVGLSFEAGVTDFLHAEIQGSLAGSESYGGNLPVQLRCKIYPALRLGLFFGAGYVHGFGGGDQGNHPVDEYSEYNGAEIFAGYMLPIICTCEAGYRFSPKAWGTHKNYSPDYSYPIVSTEEIFLREVYFSLRFDLVSW